MDDKSGKQTIEYGVVPVDVMSSMVKSEQRAMTAYFTVTPVTESTKLE